MQPTAEYNFSHPFAFRFGNDYHSVVDFNPSDDILAPVDLSPANPFLNSSVTKNTTSFAIFINNELKKNDARYLFGGYGEHREIYRRSSLFDENLQSTVVTEEPRNKHLGIDIWGPAGTPVFAPVGGTIHSMAFNNNFGDYGATIILQHQVDAFIFYGLYGHLSFADLEGKRIGQFISRAERLVYFGR